MHAPMLRNDPYCKECKQFETSVTRSGKEKLLGARVQKMSVLNWKAKEIATTPDKKNKA